MATASANVTKPEFNRLSTLQASNASPTPRKLLNPFDDDNQPSNSDIHSSLPQVRSQLQLPESSSSVFRDPPITNQVLSPQQEQRSKRLREEAVRRLVSDINRTATIDTMGVFPQNPQHLSVPSTSVLPTTGLLDESIASQRFLNAGATDSEASTNTAQQEELVIASTIASSIERGLDREFHNELKKQVQESTSVISKICHDHSDVFLGSVGRVVDLGSPCSSVRRNLDQVSF